MSIEPITGRYLTVEIEGAPRRIYFEEAGQGRPVLCLHTAGADTRQWRHLMNDAAITASNRLIAFDMPWHGKSLPPEGFETQEYLLTYLFLRLGEPAIYLLCSEFQRAFHSPDIPVSSVCEPPSLAPLP